RAQRLCLDKDRRSCRPWHLLLPANGPILRALDPPSSMLLTNAAANGIDAELARLESALAGGLRMIQVRDKTLSPSERLRLARGVMALTAGYPGARVLVNDDEALARAVGAHGLHLSSFRLMALAQRPSFERIGASRHTAEESGTAQPRSVSILPCSARSCPRKAIPASLAWAGRIRALERKNHRCRSFLGGMKPELLETAWAFGAHGIALMRGW
ncbi:thiamine phosphate synthase, partial [Propionivibrio sp.]|uniref:thiamine phosphate synthase n=1 Tax=Propionivibrio sp. TaxID=2212460 RepID=UPI0025E4D137